ncbi:hypothetical protein RF644_07540 [Kocuria sp. CPCC 205258]|uniref:hypothetical protein n=1 Tax=Kocuria sp. CPCC 205258 TaxID=3073552 RepID=UPI0034D7A4C4
MLRTQPKHLLAVAVTATGLALTGCTASEPEPDAQAEASVMSASAEPTPDLLEPDPAEPYTGPYNADFAAQIGTYPETGEISDYEGVEVILTGVVHEVINPVSVAIADPQDPSIPPLLIVMDDADESLSDGDAVEVTGTLHAAYGVPSVEENIGGPPDDDVLAHYDGEPYVWATAVNTLAPSASPTSD